MSLFEELSDVDKQIYSCLNAAEPRSFFLLAAAGSGKTRSLANVLRAFREKDRETLFREGRKIGVITYTNAACEVITNRLDNDPIFHVATIHSFSWELIRPFQADIREWVRTATQKEIQEVELQQAKGRSGSKASDDRTLRLERMADLLQRLDLISRFSYDPNGSNSERNSLNHDQVLRIVSEFLRKKELMRRVLFRQYPFLLIDESQDTRRELIETLLFVQQTNKDSFAIGLFGDMMQRIYADGKKDLEENLPAEWIKPEKRINYRSPVRIVRLLNKIREDGVHQEPSRGAAGGILRFFVVESDDTARDEFKTGIERGIAERMAELSEDIAWRGDRDSVKVLTLEHRMAARRGGFLGIFAPLQRFYGNARNFLEGKMPWVGLFRDQIFPVMKAFENGDDFLIAQIVRKSSPLLVKESVRTAKKQLLRIEKARAAVQSLAGLRAKDVLLHELIRRIVKSKLFFVPEAIDQAARNLAKRADSEDSDLESDREDRFTREVEAWAQALIRPVSEMEAFLDYISDNSRFDTHQGVKGLEFPRVMVIMDDAEAGGFLFSYDKLFGVKAESETDRKNREKGDETSIERTKRLFYVTCSRAEESLALVAYTKDPVRLRKTLVMNDWFEEDEIVMIDARPN